MEIPTEKAYNPSWLDRPLTSVLPRVNLATLIIAGIILLAVVSRFYIVDQRVMSHDEVNHVVPAYDLYQGRGYQHNPITHGPFQFHAVALSYFLLGDSDFSARVPAVLFSIATVACVLLLFPRYLGKTGAIVAGFLFLISPYMLFYGRYVRNEAFVALYGVLTLYAILRYLDRGDRFSLFLLTGATVMHFVTKETSFIYTAQALLFLAFVFIDQVSRLPWPSTARRNGFLLLMAGGIVLLGVALGLAAWNAMLLKNAGETAAQAGLSPLQMGEIAAVAAALLAGILAIVTLVRSLGLNAIRSLRSFDLLILIGTLILPQLAPFPVKIIGTAIGADWNPLDYSSLGVMRTGIFVALLTIIAAAIGLWWKPRLWLANFALFYGVFAVFYTTIFTNGFGFFTGLVGSLGYWLDQQGVHRGEQPLYYYALVQLPVYEYLAVIGAAVATYFGIRYRRFSTVPGYAPAVQPAVAVDEQSLTAPETDPEGGYPVAPAELQTAPRPLPVLSLLLFWSVSSLVAYSVAGEKMPWLTVHIALPLLLTAGWGIGFLIDTTAWRKIANPRGLLALVLLVVFLIAASRAVGTLLGTNPPFAGNTLEQLRATSTFLLALIGTVLSAGGVLRLLSGWSGGQIARLLAVTFFALLAVLTTRTAAMASYVNYDYATEYLVYAHATPAPKLVLAEIEEISRRTTGGKDLVVAYDNDGLYPYWWYFRDYPNKRWFNTEPTRDLRDVPVIIAGKDTISKVDSITEDTHMRFEYLRLWWPNQDYYNLTWERIWNTISDPEMRAAVFDIWLNRDYTRYAELKGSPDIARQFTPEAWSPADPMVFYVRNDIVSQIWDYGVVVASEPPTDPYRASVVELQPDRVIGGPGGEPGRFNTPHGIAVAPDGTLYIADAGNHRIQHLSAEGEVLHTWGSQSLSADAPAGTFNEPWSVAVAPDGSVFVADTWNHRIQKFTADGQFLASWGYFGQAEAPDAFWGPRELAVDAEGRVYVTDTGNKRIVIFDGDGNYITEFGGRGFEPGQFDEPMGIDIDSAGNVYVADTWNQRVQVFANDNLNFVAVNNWDFHGWTGNSLANYPFIAVNDQNQVVVSDPEGYRLVVFNATGEFLYSWGGYSASSDGFGLPSGLAFDQQGGLWVTDAGNHTLLHFDLSQAQPIEPEQPEGQDSP